MNHQKIYDNIIKKAKLEKRKKLKKHNINFKYYENHHILPKCLGGLDYKENLVLLTFKEHYICHKLLMYIYPKNLSIIYAFKMMSQNCHRVSDFEYAKKLYANLPASEKTKEKRLKVWFEIHCSEKAINEYLDSLKDVRCGTADQRVIHIPFKKK